MGGKLLVFGDMLPAHFRSHFAGLKSLKRALRFSFLYGGGGRALSQGKEHGRRFWFVPFLRFLSLQRGKHQHVRYPERRALSPTPGSPGTRCASTAPFLPGCSCLRLPLNVGACPSHSFGGLEVPQIPIDSSAGPHCSQHLLRGVDPALGGRILPSTLFYPLHADMCLDLTPRSPTT